MNDEKALSNNLVFDCNVTTLVVNKQHYVILNMNEDLISIQGSLTQNDFACSHYFYQHEIYMTKFFF